MLHRNTIAVVLTLFASIGCAASSSMEECSRGSDCPSGACQGGQCLPAGGGGNAGSAGTAGTAGSAGNGGSAGTAGSSGSAGQGGGGTAGSGGSGVCAPNHDGTIEKDEVPIIVGVSAKFAVGVNTAVDTAGAKQPDGSRLWDLKGPLAGDHLLLLEVQSLDNKWYAPKFPGATYAARLSDSADLLGVFELRQDGLVLRGVVSPTDGVTRTELTYQPPVTVLPFPMSEGTTWSTTSTVSGVAQGIAAAYTEKYDAVADAHGSLTIPFGTFEVLRARVTLTRTVGLLTTTIRSFSFVSECFGAVTNVTSKENESAVEFTQAAEARRLSP